MTIFPLILIGLHATELAALLRALLGWLYFTLAAWLALYSTNMLVLTLALWAATLRQKPQRAAATIPLPLPVVTVQLPLYNEQTVARRLVDAVMQLDYPSDRLQVQVLDDSTDGSTELVAKIVDEWRRRGRWIALQHRAEREDFKAGALKKGMESAQGEFIAIFDADFVPPAGWLKRAMTPFFEPGGERVGLVQTRWSHLNDDFSALTRAQALALDGHFGVEHSARHAAGLMINFNGTAGIWRRVCIEDAGGWRGATLTEDLDLSYRAQLRGWQFAYLPEVTVPAELPALMVGFKRQQFRWAKGGIQALMLLAPEILRTRTHPLRKIEGLLHLSGYIAHPLMVLLLLLLLPISLSGPGILENLPWGWMGIAGFGPALLYAASQQRLHPHDSVLRWLGRMPLLAALGMGIAVNNSRAVFEALLRIDSPFERTPKTGNAGKNCAGAEAEKITLSRATWLELGLSVYALAALVFSLHHGNWGGVLFAFLCVVGYGWVGLATIWEAQSSAAQHNKQAVYERVR